MQHRNFLFTCARGSMNRGDDSLKGSLAIHPQTAQRIRDYLEQAKHGEDLEGPLFRPVRRNRDGHDGRQHLHPDVIDRILPKYAKRIGLERGYLLGALDAGDVYHDGVGEWSKPGGCAASCGTCRPVDDQAL